MNFTNIFSNTVNTSNIFDENTLAWRETEIKRMQEFDQHKGYAGLILYGLRQTGKSFFLKRFYKNKPCIFFEASRVSLEECFAYFKLAVDTYLAENRIKLTESLQEYYSQATDISHMFIFIAILAEQFKFTLVIDEFNYLQELIPHVASSIQWVVDRVKNIDGVEFKLVLCGSNIGILRDVPAYDSPLYGRIQSALVFLPVSTLTLLRILKYPDIEERYKVAILTGGLPELILIAQDSSSFKEFVERAFLQASSRFRSLPTNLLAANRIDPDDAIQIFNAIFSGASKFNDIKQKSGLNTEFEITLKRLIDCGFIEVKQPLLSRKRVKTFTFANAALEFTYIFGLQLIPGMLPAKDIRFTSIPEEALSDFFGHYFEVTCRQFIYLNSPLKSDFAQIGYWEDTVKDGAFNHSEEFDIIAQTIDKTQLLVGECKFRNELVDMEVYQTLREKAQWVNSPAKETVYCLFSKSGFSDQVIAESLANPETLKLYTLKDFVTTDSH